jgi:1,4-alpha-glucan branching enzyme
LFIFENLAVKEFDMLKKNYSKTGSSCRVTFKLPAEVGAETAVLCGEFNEWNVEANPMKQLKDGSFSATVSLATGTSYRFRYLLDGAQWENDWEADAYVPNEHGTEDSIVEV